MGASGRSATSGCGICRRYRSGMVEAASSCTVETVAPDDQEVRALLEALTAELATGGYASEQTYGYSADQLEQSGVHLVGARVAGSLVGIAGIEVQRTGLGELKRFFVRPEQRGTGVADALFAALLSHAAASQVRLLRLETGGKQHAAQVFNQRHGFAHVPRFGPYRNLSSRVRHVVVMRSVRPPRWAG